MRLFAAVLLAPLAWGANCVPIGQIRPAGSVQGTLSEANCRLSDGTAFAEYVLYLPTQGEIDLRADAAAFPVNLLVRDSSGRKLADGAAIRRTLERGEYSVAVNTAEAAKGGAFTLRSAFTPEPNTLCRTARPLGAGTSVAGRLGASSCKLPDQSAYDAYLVTPLAPGSIEISLDTQDFESYLALRNGDGRALAVDTRKIVLPIKGDED
ncbi:MAG: hypothetical protein HY013_18475, partial [Candidatus Solibacter usitatus]|nr:hypothetical protein [Candidatus Solibacter usitatus]